MIEILLLIGDANCLILGPILGPRPILGPGVSTQFNCGGPVIGPGENPRFVGGIGIFSPDAVRITPPAGLLFLYCVKRAVATFLFSFCFSFFLSLLGL